MKNSVNTNLLIFDEIFDASLDQEGIDNVVSLLYDLSNDTNVFVISHKETMAERFQRTLRFEKIKNFSTLTKET